MSLNQEFSLNGVGVRIRPNNPDDLSFIYATWLRGTYYGNDWFQQMERKTYFKEYTEVVRNILHKDRTQILIAAMADTPDIILAYSVYEPGILHYVFTKSAWRSQGIARKLIPVNTTHYTHLTHMGKRFKPKDWIFNPFLI